MPERIQFEIDAADAPEYIEIVQRKRLLVDEEIERKQAEINKLINKSVELGFVLERLRGDQTPKKAPEDTVGKAPPTAKPVNGYDAKWSVWDKVQYVLSKQIEPMSKVEIIDKIGMFEPRVAALEGKKKRAFSVAVSACLSTKSSEAVGKLNRIAKDGEVYKYYI